MKGRWVRTNRQRKCPICGKPDWCGISEDGNVACCMRVQSEHPMRNGGWMHRIAGCCVLQYSTVLQYSNNVRSNQGYTIYAQHALSARNPVSFGVATNWPVLVEAYQHGVNPMDLELLAHSLGLLVTSLRALRIGWDGEAWCFTMQRPDGTICGIRRRLPNGRKLSVKGGHEGLFVPTDLNGQDPLFITEGPTDCAALHGLGLSVFGRPSCRGALGYCQAMARGRDVVIVPDADQPGREGAVELAQALTGVAKSVRAVVPPVKDAREWVKQGLTKEQLL